MREPWVYLNEAISFYSVLPGVKAVDEQVKVDVPFISRLNGNKGWLI